MTVEKSEDGANLKYSAIPQALVEQTDISWISITESELQSIDSALSAATGVIRFRAETDADETHFRNIFMNTLQARGRTYKDTGTTLPAKNPYSRGSHC